MTYIKNKAFLALQFIHLCLTVDEGIDSELLVNLIIVHGIQY